MLKEHNMEDVRIEHDSMGEVEVPADKHWGAQTERSRRNFKIGQRMPEEVIQAFAILKSAAATANEDLGCLDNERANIIRNVCEEILSGSMGDEFPLVVYQTGSGTQTNMNVNEVIANRGNELAGRRLLHPNDHVNMSQSSNDTFPTAMNIAAVMTMTGEMIPKAEKLRDAFAELEEKYADIVKVGRTHLQDATPLTLGQEISGWRSMLDHDIEMVLDSAEYLKELAIGGTAVGTGLNCPEGFDIKAAECISRLTGIEFLTAENKFHALTSRDAFVHCHGALKALAADLMKIANDIRLLASGPRCGVGELSIPANEPGSSIMPGKVNPTQCEAVTMVAARVMGNDVTIGIAASQGNYELNVYAPVIIYTFLESAKLLAESMNSFCEHLVKGIKPVESTIKANLEQSLMLVTALSPHIGYENAAVIARKAFDEDTTLREAAIASGLVTAEDFDAWVVPEEMV